MKERMHDSLKKKKKNHLMASTFGSLSLVGGPKWPMPRANPALCLWITTSLIDLLGLDTF